MKQNMGKVDQMTRVIIALVVALLFFSNTITGIFGYVLLAVGAVFLLTSLAGSCPLYTLFSMNTCPVKNTGK